MYNILFQLLNLFVASDSVQFPANLREHDGRFGRKVIDLSTKCTGGSCGPAAKVLLDSGLQVDRTLCRGLSG